MAAITPAYFEFTGPGFLTLIQNHHLVGKAYIQHQVDGEWKRLYDADKNPVEIGWPAETIPVDVPLDTLWRVAAPYFDCEGDVGIEFTFYNADLNNQPEVDLPEYNGHPIRCDNKSGSNDYVTNGVTFDGPGILRLVDPGPLASPAEVYVVYNNDPTMLRSTRFYKDGEAVSLGTGVESVELKGEATYLVNYRVARKCADPADVIFDLMPVDYTGGLPPPLDPPIFDGVIPDLVGEVGVPITPYDSSTHFQTGGAVETYHMNAPIDGITFDTVTGILSGAFNSEISGSFRTIQGKNDAGSSTSDTFEIIGTIPAEVVASEDT